MLASLIEKRLLVPTLMVLAMLPVLLGLGMWQLDRLAWKDELIRTLTSRVKSPEVPLSSLLDQAGRLTRPAEAFEYTAVIARGRFLHDKESRIYAPDPQRGPGYEIVTPFELEGSGAVILVNRGYVPEAKKDPATRPAGQTRGPAEVTGLVRAPGTAGTFTPPYDAKADLWFWRDFDGMIARHFGTALPPTIPIFVEVTRASEGGFPAGAATRLDIPNRHLEYALTWFGLAAALLAVFAVYVRSRLRDAGRD